MKIEQTYQPLEVDGEIVSVERQKAIDALLDEFNKYLAKSNEIKAKLDNIMGDKSDSENLIHKQLAIKDLNPLIQNLNQAQVSIESITEQFQHLPK